MDDVAAKLCTGEFSSLMLSFNEFKTDYITAEQAIADDPQYFSDDSFTPGGREQCIATNTIWTLHYYPRTPVGFCVVHGPTCEAVLKAAQENKP